MKRLYPATLVRAIDGDTVILKVDLGFHISAEVTFRLARINCPERGSPRADEARKFTHDWCSAPLQVQSTKGDRYGRWIAEIYADGQTVTISDALLAAGLAEKYPKP